jgi:acyl-CoA hydrolase
MTVPAAPQRFQSADLLANAIIERVGKKIVLALPLGLGKANHIANALFAKAVADPGINLHIFTALTLERPRARQELERRFVEPLNERLFKGYPDLSYVAALRSGKMPPNIKVNEFFFLAGSWLGNGLAQQNYISANYTHALQYVLDIGVNVIGQLVARRTSAGGESFSIASNPDLTCDLLSLRRAGKAKFLFAGETSSEMPFMGGEAEVAPVEFDCLLEGPANDYPLFAPPREPIALADYAAGLHAARTVRDGGTLQIGIGSSGDAVAKALVLRHQNSAEFRNLLARLNAREVAAPLDNAGSFSAGLYGCTEMFVEGLFDLFEAGVLKREVDGAVLHAAFFLGSRKFYKALHEMPDAQRGKFHMTPVSFVNEIYGDEAKKRAARVHARFINDAMMATLLGDVVSDGLDNGQVVSGVGGQYNFISQGFALEGARAIIMLHSHRITKGKALSNIRWNYGHTTIPRHLRDVIITEYGVADLRGKADRDVIAAMLSIADARFQDELLQQAKHAGKIERSFEIPAAWRNNTPEFIESALRPARDAGALPAFPFGTDFTVEEQQLLPALKTLKAASSLQLASILLRGLSSGGAEAALARMSLARPSGLKERLYAALVRGAIRVSSRDANRA